LVKDFNYRQSPIGGIIAINAIIVGEGYIRTYTYAWHSCWDRFPSSGMPEFPADLLEANFP